MYDDIDPKVQKALQECVNEFCKPLAIFGIVIAALLIVCLFCGGI